MAAEVAIRGGGSGRELAMRVVVGAGLATVAAMATGAGDCLFSILIGVAASVAWLELSKLENRNDLWKWTGLIALAVAIYLQYLGNSGHSRIVILSYMSLNWLVSKFNDRVEYNAIAILMVALPAMALIQLRALSDGLAWVAFTFAVVWSADIAAYAVGRTVGGPKLWPAISPNKTWAGFAGACAAACGAAVAVVPYVHIAPLRAAVAGLLLGALAQGGDLFESALKRRAGVKDSGNLLPGHGGVLDRIDSLIPVAPAVAGAVALGWL